MRPPPAPMALLLLLCVCCGLGAAQARYWGRELGSLSQLHHGVRGRLFAVDARTIYLQDFYYDGEGPAAFFYVGTSKTPAGGAGAARLRDERGGTGPLRRYRGEALTLSLPEGTTLRDYRWFSVWCDEFSVNFGDVQWSREVEFPRPARVGALRGVHGVASDPVVVVDAQTLLVPNFSYDGEAPDAKFWVGRGDKPSPQGIRIPDENGKEAPLRKYDKKTIVLTLPGELTVFDIGHFGVWCEAFTVNFGHVLLPHAQLANVPPSLKMLGVSPQSKLNCEVLFDELAFEVRWAVAGDSIVLQLVAKLEDGEYMSFGLSGSDGHSQMVGGDVAVAWVDKATLKGYAHDYYLDAKSQCAGVRGSCPDERLGEKTNSIRLLNAALVNGYSIVTYQRSLRAADELDRPVFTNRSQPIIWALGPLNSRDEVSYHHHFTKGDKFIEFGRPPLWNCPMPEGEDETRPSTSNASQASSAEETKVKIKPNPVPTPAPTPSVQPWEIPAIQCYEPPDGVFYAQMGPTGGKQGYSAITGHVGWGISWYINGLLIPEITVVRGKRYTFVVEGGSDPDVPARYHPFYITNDPVGGYYHKTDEEKKSVDIYAGVRRTRSGELLPTGVGRLCNWTPDTAGPEADEFPSFGAYQRSLTLICEEGNPGVVTWIPDKNTPDTVYYQCFTHRYLGWKINVVNECDYEAEESTLVQTVLNHESPEPDLEQEESIQVHSRVRPDSNFLDERRKIEKIINTKTNYNDFSSEKVSVGLTGEILRPESERNPLHNQPQEYELPPIITNGQIRDVIEAVESLENSMKEHAQRNISQPSPHRYQVYENVKEMFVPEQPVHEEDEYVVEKGKVPNSYFLPPNQKPLTLQSVLKPNGPNKMNGNMRPPFRRPVPPEIKLRRPPPHSMNQKHTGGFPLPMPNHHGLHGMPKKPYNKPPFYRNPPNNRPPLQQSPSGTSPMNRSPVNHQSPTHHPKPMFNKIPFQSPPTQKPQIIKVYKPPNSPVQSIIMGKPTPGNVLLPSQSQTLNLGRTDIIANQIVKSQIMLPGTSDSIGQSSIQQSFINQPGQIILGKPMDHPVPLDQQMAPTKLHVVNSPTPPPESRSSTYRIRLLGDKLPALASDIKSSDFIGEFTEPSTLRPAVNTGFKPNTIVIESGFKPIIREPLMDRSSDYDTDNKSNMNRREDTDVEEDYEESPQPIANHAYKTPSDKITETFEPMFIPSPPDYLLQTNDRTKEVFPKNHAKEDRPHPVYMKSESKLNTLFSQQNMEKEVPLDMVMESDRVSPQYLPPDPKLPNEQSQKLTKNEQTYTTYDGKTISAATLTSVPDIKPLGPKLYSSKLPANTELLLKTPQFGPFKGEIPPLMNGPLAIIPHNDTQKPIIDTKITHLKLVNAFQPENEAKIDDLTAEGSEKREVTTKSSDKGEVTTENDKEEEEYGEGGDSESYEGEEETVRKRRRRDTKATQFERGEVEEQTNKKISGDTKNQIDFRKTSNNASKLNWSSLILLSVCLKLV